VEGFRSRDPDIDPPEAQKARGNASAFFLLGEKYARILVPPVLITGCGLMGSGKSTVAKALDSYLDIVLLSSDRIRKELAGMDPTSPHHVPFGSDIYSREFGARTYGELHNRAVTLMKGGQSVFLDASYMTRDLRDLAVEAAREGGAGFLLVYMDPGEEELRKRLRRRMMKKGGISDGREELLGDQIRSFEPPAEVPEEQKLIFTSSDALDQQVRESYRRLLKVRP
jgi:predicted kinase